MSSDDQQTADSPSGWDEWLAASVADLQRRSLFRTLRPTLPGLSAVEASLPQCDIDAWVEGRPPPSAAMPSLAAAEMRTIKLFSLNDYLGLSSHPDVRAAAADAALKYGNGPRSSALVGGYTHVHAQLERRLAELKGTEACLLFPTGFAANLAVLASLASSASGGDEGPLYILSDELNHASIVDGAALARRRTAARLLVYRHGDLAHLAALLEAEVPPAARAVVVTDSLFSMDGDFADLAGLARLKRRRPFLLVVDEAHATLVCGERGGGAAEAQGAAAAAAVDLHVGTLSKAFGCQGGFVACSAAWKAFLANRGRSQVFSTALPVPVAAAALAALRVAQEEPWRREHVWRLARRLGQELGVPVTSPIVPLVVGSEQAAVDASMALLRRGFHVPAIRPPTVPRGTSRLRVSLSAAHTEGDVQQLVEAIRACGLTFQPLPAAHGTALCNAGEGTASGSQVAGGGPGKHGRPAASAGVQPAAALSRL